MRSLRVNQLKVAKSLCVLRMDAAKMAVARVAAMRGATGTVGVIAIVVRVMDVRAAKLVRARTMMCGLLRPTP
jgi:hypothetical protein